MTRRRIGLLGVAYVVVSVAAATVLVWPVFQTSRLVLVSGVAALLGMTIGLLSLRLRWAGWVTAVVGLLAYLLAVVPAAVPYRATGDQVGRGVLEAVAAVVLGWQRLLTLKLPVEDYRASLAPWFALILAVSLVAVVVAVREDRWAGWAAPLLALPVVVAGLLGPIVPGRAMTVGPFTLPDAATTLAGSGFVVASVAWFAVRARVRRAQALARAVASTGVRRRRRTASLMLLPTAAGLVLVMVAVAAGTVGTAAASAASDRRTVREHVEPVLVLQSQPSPLDRYRLAFSGEAATTPMFTVSVDGAPVDVLRLAVLDAYDGQHFTVSAGESRDFIRMPRRSADAADSTVTVQIADSSPGIWMPVPAGMVAAPTFAGPRSDQLAAAFYVSEAGSSAIDVASTGLSEAGLQPGDSYTVQVRSQHPGTLGDPSDASLLDTQTYPELVAWVKAQGQPRSADGFASLIDILRNRGYLSHWLAPADARQWLAAEDPGMPVVASYAGHSAARVEDLFAQLNDQQDAVGTPADDADLVAAVGDDEQFAAAAALLARYLGYESRVVLGVRLVSAGEPACDGTCTGADLAAWVEVRSAGGPWVPFDVDPQTQNPPRPVTQGQEPPSNATRPQQPDPTVVDPPDVAQDSVNASTVVPNPDPPAQPWWATALRVVSLSIAVLALAALPALTIPAAKAARRRRRRRARVPEVACVGAWAELEDRCLDLGVPLEGPTRRAAARATERPAAAALAELVDMAVYGSAPVGTQTGSEAWALIRDDLAEVQSQISGWRRAMAWFHPRSMLNALSSSDRPGPSARTSVKEPR